MRRLLLLSALLASACGSNLANPARRVNLPRAMAAAALGTDAVASTDIVAVGLCDPANSWNTNRWYAIDIDGARQPFSGPLLADVATGPNCYATQKVFTFAPGTHDVKVSLINHCNGGTDPDPICQACAKTAGCDPAADSISPATALTVTSAPASCASTLSAQGQSFAAAGGTGNVAITTTAGCAWTASSAAPWVTAPAGGTGPGSITFTVAANTTTAGRTGMLTIAGQAFMVSQAGVTTTDPCAVPLGVDIPSVVVLRWGPSPLKAGQRAYVLYQLASRTPIVEIVVKVNDAPVKTVAGPDYTDDAATWFTAPATKGTYKLSVSARNAVCPARETVSSVSLVTK